MRVIAAQSHLILGGVRSGKSRHALALARSGGGRTAFLASAQPLDPDMAARVARHRAERPAGWQTIEEPFDLVGACRRLRHEVDLVLVDCLTLWVSNQILRGDKDEAILAAGEDLARFLGDRAPSVILVSNEVGAGVHPPTRVGRRFSDLLGMVNQQVAQAADRVTLMVAGVPMTVKSPAAPVTSVGPPSMSHDIPPQAP